MQKKLEKALVIILEKKQVVTEKQEGENEEGEREVEQENKKEELVENE